MAPEMVRCDFCGYSFDPACSEQSCSACPLASACGKLACPRCGYEILREAKLIGWLRALRANLDKKKATQRCEEINHVETQ